MANKRTERKPLKAALAAAGVRQIDVAERAGVSERWVRYVLAGTRVSRPVARAISELIAARNA